MAIFLLVFLACLGLPVGRGLAGSEAAENAQAILVSPDGLARIGGRSFRCSLGAGGVRQDKREGDGTTPAGDFPLREVFYRADRLPSPPASGLPLRALQPDDGWCDDPASPQYNQRVKLPFPASHEQMWREDGLYDLVLVVGYNDDPPVAGLGSAIFLHVARPGYAPTAGCVAFSLPDLLSILKMLGPSSRVAIQEAGGR